MRAFLISAGAICMATVASAETLSVNTTELPGKTVYEVAKMTPLALTEAGTPAVVQLSLPAGAEVPPHAANTGLRLITVIKGELSWGDGETADQTAEATYSPGALLVLPAGQAHWLAARKDDVVLQIVILDDEAPVPALKDMLN